MDYAIMGRTGVRVSSLAFGTMSFGREADRETSAALYRRCREVGINLFDCADVYAKGESERILGELVAGERDELVLATKAYFPTGDGPNHRGASRYHLVRAVEASLRRLNTDRIDLLYVHKWDDSAAVDETMRALDHLVDQGKVLYLGASNFAAWQVMKALGVAERRGLAPLVALQPMYNLVKRQAEVELLPMAWSEDLAVFPYSPLGGGLLSGKYRRSDRPEAGRLQWDNMYQLRYGDDLNFEVAERFAELARERDLHPATLAVAWVRAHPSVTAPLLGARSLEQLEPLLAAADLELDEDTYDAVGALAPRPPPATDRSEERTGVEYAKT
jgi:aryl-alcohol dehydrogenase-like predicted oxidoreductase